MSEKTELEIAKQTLKNSKDPAEREKVQQKYDALLEKDIASDKEVIAACSNGNAGSSACASARLKVIASKEGYEDGPGNDSNLLIVFYVQIMPDDFVMQLHR
ncbi:hypothetical protein R9M89_01875, partial [Escherichia coli]